MYVSTWLLLMLLFNGLAAWWLASAVGTIALEARVVGGTLLAAVRVGAGLAASGFGLVSLVAIALCASRAGLLPAVGPGVEAVLHRMLLGVPALEAPAAVALSLWSLWGREDALLRLDRRDWNRFAALHARARSRSSMAALLEDAVDELRPLLGRGDGVRAGALAAGFVAAAVPPLVFGAVMACVVVRRAEASLPLPDAISNLALAQRR